MTHGPHIPFTPNARYPNPAVKLLTPEFAQYRVYSSSVEQLASGCRWSEGPVWFGDHRCLLWSDIPGNRILRWDEASGAVWAYDVAADGALSGKRLHIDADGAGALDGIAVDANGNTWCGWGSDGRPGAPAAELDGVRVFNPQGQAIGHIHLPERCANLCFGGMHRNRLFMAASHSLYALYVNVQGAA